MGTGRSGPRVLVIRLALLALLLAAWEGFAGGLGPAWRLVDPIIVGRPSGILADLRDYALSGLLSRDLRTTLIETFLGLGLGIAGGVAVGLLFGYWRTMAEVLEPLMVALNSLPRITVAPIVILWFGLGMTSKVMLSLFTVFFVMFFNTFLGIRTVDGELIKAVRVMGGTARDVTRMVVIPSVTSWIFAALRTSVSFALSGAVVGEFIGSTEGLGYRMLIAAGTLETDRVFAIMILLMVIGSGLVELTRRVEGYLLRWRPSVVEMG
jgi:NitT/TauT family transport system permease protein